MRAFLRALSFRMLALALILTLLAAPQAQATGEKPRTSGFAACAKVLCTLLQFRNKKPLTSVTFGGNI